MDVNKKNLNEDYLRASARMDELKAFYRHILTYVLIIPFLIVINYMTYWDYKWFWFPMVGWGIGLGIHALVTYGFGSDWEKRKIREIMENEKYK
jgi:hypothetical protein